jgi:hypothetical protein
LFHRMLLVLLPSVGLEENQKVAPWFQFGPTLEMSNPIVYDNHTKCKRILPTFDLERSNVSHGPAPPPACERPPVYRFVS